MADVISLKDGSVETIFEPKDFKYLVEKFMGYVAEIYFERLISEMEEAVDEAQDKEQSDRVFYEASLELNTVAFNDIQDVCRSMIAEFNSEQDRNKLATLRPWRNKVEQIIKIINIQI